MQTVVWPKEASGEVQLSYENLQDGVIAQGFRRAFTAWWRQRGSEVRLRVIPGSVVWTRVVATAQFAAAARLWLNRSSS